MRIKILSISFGIILSTFVGCNGGGGGTGSAQVPSATLPPPDVSQVKKIDGDEDPLVKTAEGYRRVVSQDQAASVGMITVQGQSD